ncbi:MAG: cation-transporting P-type ATPase, partial [Thermoanaerobaculia bacterium]
MPTPLDPAEGHLDRAHQLPVDEVLASLRTDARNGLTAADATERLALHGPNELRAEKPVPAWRRFLAQFQDALVILLLAAGVISLVLWLIERESSAPYEALAIFAIVLANAVLGYVQEARA